jgi:outer membrane protein TolC
MARQSLNLWRLAIPAIAALGVVGCRSANRVHDPEYAWDVHRIHQARTLPSGSALAPVANELAGPHPVDTYIRHALTQNPDIQAARKQVEATAFRVPQASSLRDPMLQITAYPEPVHTAAGQQELLLNVSQKFPWFGKLRAQADVAELNTNVARAQLVAVELSVIEEVKLAYYELYLAQQAVRITESNRPLLVTLKGLAEGQLRMGLVSQQDVLRAELEISKLENELIRLRQELQSAQARLARQLHISPDTPVLALDQLSAEQIPSDLQLLYTQAVEARPELHAQLAAIQRDRRAVDRARLDYFPDPTLGVTSIDTATAGISPVATGRDRPGPKSTGIAAIAS